MNADILQRISDLLKLDSSVSPGRRKAILRLCKQPPSTNQKPGRMLTARQAAEILGCCPRSVHRYARRGLLTPCRRSARSIRFRENEVQALAEGKPSEEVS